MGKMVKRTSVTFSIFGTIMILVGMFLFGFRYFTKDKYIDIDATIVGIYNDDDDDSYTLVEYVVDGQTYCNSISMYSSTYYIGKIIKIQYHINNPDKIRSYWSLIIAGSIVSFMGVVFSGIGYGMLINNTKNNHKLMNAKKNGRKRIGKVIAIHQNRHYYINDRHPCNIECICNIDGKEITLKSKNIWKELDYEEGLIVNVYCNNGRNFIDAESLRKADDIDEIISFE